MSYSMSLLCGIKQYQLPVALVELEIEQRTEEEDGYYIEIVTVYFIKMPNYGDYNSTPVLYLLSNLGSNFNVQPHFDNNENKDNSVMSNINIFMKLINAFYLIFLFLLMVGTIKMTVISIVSHPGVLFN
jgi:hypothetical protein